MERIEESAARILSREWPLWQCAAERGGTITRELTSSGFVPAFAFMTRIALEAEKRNHHPEWHNVYKRVRITLTSHDANGLSMADIDLPRVIDAAFAPIDARA